MNSLVNDSKVSLCIGFTLSSNSNIFFFPGPFIVLRSCLVFIRPYFYLHTSFVIYVSLSELAMLQQLLHTVNRIKNANDRKRNIIKPKRKLLAAAISTEFLPDKNTFWHRCKIKPFTDSSALLVLQLRNIPCVNTFSEYWQNLSQKGARILCLDAQTGFIVYLPSR